jgi:hypothetical protein
MWQLAPSTYCHLQVEQVMWFLPTFVSYDIKCHIIRNDTNMINFQILCIFLANLHIPCMKFGKKWQRIEKFKKENLLQHPFFFSFPPNIFNPKANHRVWMLRPRQFFRHQDQQNWLTSYFDVFYVVWHKMSYY